MAATSAWHPHRLLASLLLSSTAALAGQRRRALSRSGAAGAVMVGSAVYYGGGWRWSGLLLAFFVSSSGLSRLAKHSPPARASEGVETRGSQRDIVQVLANGGSAAGLALAHAASPHPALCLAYAGAIAAANADTWATEIGKTSPRSPRLLFTLQKATAGTSGAVSLRGLLASAAGSALIGAASAAMAPAPARRIRWGVAVSVAGVLGAFADSLAGATVQAAYWCSGCGMATERRLHRCGTRTVLIRGWACCNNDMVNVACTVTGAILATCMAGLFGALHRTGAPGLDPGVVAPQRAAVQ